MDQTHALHNFFLISLRVGQTHAKIDVIPARVGQTYAKANANYVRVGQTHYKVNTNEFFLTFCIY